MLTFLAVVVGWVFFRAESFGAVGGLLAGLSGVKGFRVEELLVNHAAILWIAVGMIVCFRAPNSWEIKPRTKPRLAIVYGMLLALCVLRLDEVSPFLYFQF